MKEIQLSKLGKNKGMYVALVDDEDYERANQFNWFAMKEKNTIYVRRNIIINGKQQPEFLHWFIMGGRGVDHIFHNGLDNQKHNLRLCTKQQNLMNKKSYKNSSSKYKGVSFNRQLGRWVAYIRIDRLLTHIGYYNNEEDAAKAYNEKALELFGEFANINTLTR